MGGLSLSAFLARPPGGETYFGRKASSSHQSSKDSNSFCKAIKNNCPKLPGQGRYCCKRGACEPPGAVQKNKKEAAFAQT